LVGLEEGEKEGEKKESVMCALIELSVSKIFIGRCDHKISFPIKYDVAVS
jgi:hypothetical protein